MLVVPIHLDALVLDTEEPLVEATADFSVLPYVDGAHVFNSDTANVSADVVSPPFQNQNLYLKRGVHLHWALPDALTRVVSPAQPTGDPAVSQPSKPPLSASPVFPVVPNCWLVIRTVTPPDETKPPQAWVVESDYLYPAGEGEQSGSISYLYSRDPNTPQRPYRRLERKLAADAWPLSSVA